MSHALFSHNPEYCVDIIRAYAPEFTPRIAFILGSGQINAIRGVNSVAYARIISTQYSGL